MAKIAALPSPPPGVRSALDACPPPARAAVAALRALIIETAAGMPEVGPLTETLKWGQPAYLTQQTKSGTTIRLGWGEDGRSMSLFVHCQTSLVDAWRQQYNDQLTFIGNREISIPTHTDLPRAPLQHCIAMALTYHSRKTPS
ncbi:MAG: DUF1801 domain-containing protein [Henriciella sp.]|nr:DUF1801 domain-containing protein [Henriciella sp.]MBO6695041.1 DUF1801 domain-containing protein [Henriciella sp.]